MKVVVEGCCHGELERIYDVIGQLQEKEGVTVDLLICCGDFQAVRDRNDLQSMAVPPKYREMGSFYKYYSGEKKAPVLTIFIGGNHEASNYLWELPYGGWVAENIYYLGRAGVVRYGSLRIAGLSGIYKEGDYRKGYFERPPFTEGTKRSVYHVRSSDVFRLKQVSGHVDIGLSHDWPQGIYHHGNKAQLLRKKPYFTDEVAEDRLGSPAAMELLKHLQPSFWFSAHLHVKFAAVYRHGDDTHTKFLALDKCLPGRRYLQVLDISCPSLPPYRLTYDPEWLAILRSTESLMGYSQLLWLPPHPSTNSRVGYTPDSREAEEIESLFRGDLTIHNNFTECRLHDNNQTLTFCNTLGISNHYTTSRSSLGNFSLLGSPGNSLCGNTSAADISNPDEIDLGDSDEGEEHGSHDLTNETSAPPSSDNKRSYPWLDDLSGDEQVKTSQTSYSTAATAVTEGTEHSEVTRESHDPSCDAGGENPDEIDLDEEEGNLGSEVDSEGSKVKAPLVIKRRNVAIYQSHDDDIIT